MGLKKDRLKMLITRMVLEREVNGYEVVKELSLKGIQLRSNYVYKVLLEMERDGQIKGRWLANRNGPRKHVYSLTDHGLKEFRLLIKDSLDLLMRAFNHVNVGFGDRLSVAGNTKAVLKSLGVPIRSSKDLKVVFAIAGYDPLICYPSDFYAASEIFPDAAIHIVKPPEVILGESKRNLTLLDGFRHDMPFKDDFADYLILEGFPKYVSEERTIRECIRVLKPEGHLIIRVLDVMIEEKAPSFPHFGDYVSKLFYDLDGRDRMISIERVANTLTRQFAQTNETRVSGSTFLYAVGKKRAEIVTGLRESRRTET